MPETSRIAVSVVYAEPDHVFDVELSLPRESTVADAIEQSGLRVAYPLMNLDEDRVGIFSRKMRLDTPLRDGDRVEVYRPLKIDPKEARRKRAREL
ncbi:MAG TPA: RnfH family protein [Rhodanobacteraceae bacterium]